MVKVINLKVFILRIVVKGEIIWCSNQFPRWSLTIPSLLYGHPYVSFHVAHGLASVTRAHDINDCYAASRINS